ncbi:MAG: two-component sensor histidine kinase [Verrucomicrobiaceae bacterium]|nr:two-component sensor histidine kinase [Verrucomicrobiaceae bacterium]
MRLADFIPKHMEKILTEWEAFAATLLPAAGDMTSLALRDHAQLILEAVVTDLGTFQSKKAQSEKSKGLAPQVAGAAETAAQTHAVLRAGSGFDINQLVAEYRALRASVLELWMDNGALETSGVEDIIRFNEAIDQAIAESVGHFHRSVDRYRNLLLGMLGHDMRSPLNAIQLTASYLNSLDAGEEVSESAARVMRSGASMQALLDDLVDFNRLSLGLGLKVVASEIDLAPVVACELEQLRAANPHYQIEMTTSPDIRGRCDALRIQQLLRNLVSNAINYGSRDKPVRVNLRCEEAHICLEVINWGPPLIPPTLQ